jgi:protein SCO1/2
VTGEADRRPGIASGERGAIAVADRVVAKIASHVAREALSRFPERDNVQVVFVTTDPERDTPKSLGKWLTAFGENFTGLSGDLAKVKKAALSVGISVEDPKKHHDGTVTSDHGTQVIAFTPKDNQGRVVYTHGTTVDDFAHDLPLLVKNTR